MRIAFHATRAPTFKHGLILGGDKPFVNQLVVGLQERGHEVKFVSRLNARDVWRGRISVRQLIAEALKVCKEMRRFAPDAWLVYETSVTNPDLFGWWQRPARYVMMQASVGSGKRVPRAWRWLFRFAQLRSLKRADKIAAAHASNIDQLLAVGIAADRLSILPVAVNGWDGVPSRVEARQRLSLPREAPVLLCASRFSLEKMKGRSGKTEMILDLLAAVSALPADALLVLPGDGPGRPLVEEAAVRLGIEGRVRLAGSVPHDEMKWYYAACDVFAYPCRTDRPWLTVLEAQSCGRPVVTLHTRSAELTVDAGRTGLLAKDLAEFSALLAALACDRARCAAMGEAAQDYVARHHSMKVRIGQIEELLSGTGPG